MARWPPTGMKVTQLWGRPPGLQPTAGRPRVAWPTSGRPQAGRPALHGLSTGRTLLHPLNRTGAVAVFDAGEQFGTGLQDRAFGGRKQLLAARAVFREGRGTGGHEEVA